MPQQSSATRFVTAFIIGMLLSVFAWFLVIKPPAPSTSQNTATTTPSSITASTTPASAPRGTTPAANSTLKTSFGTLGITGNGTIEQVPVARNTQIAAPVFSKPLAFSNNVSSEMRTALTAQFAQNQKEMAKNKLDFNTWLDLGLLRKSAGDYQGAKEVWEYVGKVWPANIVSFSNLGDLYQSFLHDYAKADSNYKIALKNNPTDPTLYRALFDLYSNTSYKPTSTAAVDILKKGIEQNPAALDLHVLLARYYIKAGNPSAAKIEYELAINLAKQQGNTAAQNDLTTEAASVR